MSNTAANNNITTVTHTASGASCQIHAHGATILSFATGDGKEHLFVSKQAKLDGSKAIRGGIPICFPIFGPPQHRNSSMPQHGFGRVNAWTLQSTRDEADAAGAVYTLELGNVTAGRGNDSWSPSHSAVDGTDCRLTYEIRVEAQQLTCTLVVDNTGQSSFDFQALLHTYFAVEDTSKCSVHGLGGYAITDKVSGDSGHLQSYDDDVVIQGETDRVYIHPDDHPVVHVDLKTPTGKIRIEAAGQVDEAVAPVSCVVWNPGPEKAAAMSDFGNDEYHKMICVEPGLIGHQAVRMACGFE